MPKPRITKVEIETFTYELSDLARGEHGPTYSPGKSITNTAHAITIFTDVGVTGRVRVERADRVRGGLRRRGDDYRPEPA